MVRRRGEGCEEAAVPRGGEEGRAHRLRRDTGWTTLSSSVSTEEEMISSTATSTTPPGSYQDWLTGRRVTYLPRGTTTGTV